MSNSKIKVLQHAITATPVADYLIFSLALALGASYIIGEAGATIAMLTKVLVASTILSLWWLMVY